MMTNLAVAVIGASGFGRETIDVLEAMILAGSQIRITGAVDDDPSEANLAHLRHRGVDYLGSIANWMATSRGRESFVLAIGNPSIREGLVKQLAKEDFSAFTAIHPQATLGSCATIARGSVICAGAVVSTNVAVAEYVHINPNATIGHDALIGSFVSINPAATISGGVRIGTGALVGAGAIILQNLSVGSRAIVGAGSVVTRDVPLGRVVKGVPGRWDD